MTATIWGERDSLPTLDEQDDDLLFSDEPDEIDDAPSSWTVLPPWRVLIVDDDPEVHAITRVVLGDVVFEQRRIAFLSAYSAAEAREIIAADADISAILLDVVMETDDAGLQLIQHIREHIGNTQVRIILRTGQPGQAPERQVVVDYDINDYKAKSELTAQKLFTATIAALRSYQHIAAIERGRHGLAKIVDSSTSLFEERTRERFTHGVIDQLESLICGADAALLCGVGYVGSTMSTDRPVILAASGRYRDSIGRPVEQSLAQPLRALVLDVLSKRCNRYAETTSVIHFGEVGGSQFVILVEGHPPLSTVDRQLIEIFCDKVTIGFENIHLYEQLINAQKATIYALGKMAEYKDEVTGNHVRRVEILSTLIVRELYRCGAFPDIINKSYCEQIGMASILHDVGKIGIPDSILRKPGTLDSDEMVVMRSHTGIGAKVLREAAGLVAGDSYLLLGSEIAASHHERFDGTGYPLGLAGDAIPLSGRIVALADVFDALLHHRPYKEAWSLSATLAHIRRESGGHFDPRVVQAFLSVIEQGLAEDLIAAAHG